MSLEICSANRDSAFFQGNVVWLDEMTATRALINMSTVPEEGKEKPSDDSKKAAETSQKGRGL